jgi:DNA-binding NtrC family response regulator
MRILLVEDDTKSRNTLGRLLKRWGFEVAAAENLRRGLSFLRAEHFDGIVSDIALPDGTGYALISAARRNARPMFAVAVSGFRYPEEVQTARLTGFDHHLEKPVDAERLRSLLDEALHPGTNDHSPNARTRAGCSGRSP